MSFVLIVAGASMTGRRRDNGDAWSATSRRVVVADGGGRYARAAGLRAVAAAMHRDDADPSMLFAAADAGVHTCGDGAYATMAIVELVDGVRPEIVVAHVGDTLVFSVVPPGRLTVPHHEAALLACHGVLSAAEAARSPLAHRLTRHLGRGCSDPVLQRLPAAAGARFVVATDGAYRELGDRALVEQAVRSVPADAAAQAILDAAFDAGSVDNLTAVVVDVHELPAGV